MVSWSEDNNEDSFQYDSASDADIIKIDLNFSRQIFYSPMHTHNPATTEHFDFEGSETDILVLCHEHGKPAERHVAFEGIYTGRGFLACAEKEGKNCGLVEWIEQAWPATLENASAMLWEMYEECKINKIEDKVMSSFAVHNLTQEKIKL
ncbi:hypothetical protein ZWY2020_004174 [Hordeum vulgare]|nr:hypothetical protein ZWY2020_004174 [Hordeum vulgare]